VDSDWLNNFFVIASLGIQTLFVIASDPPVGGKRGNLSFGL